MPSPPKPWKVRIELHIKDDSPGIQWLGSSSSSHPTHPTRTRILFTETIALPPLPAIAPNRADISLSDLDTVILTNLRVALLRPRRRATTTELRRLNGLFVKDIYAWWNSDAREQDSRGRSVKRMTQITDRNIGEVLNGVRLGGGSNCLVVYAEMPRAMGEMGLPARG